MFELSYKKTSTQEILERHTDPQVGGRVTFEGLVRNHNEGKTVKSLEYEVFAELALSVGNEIVQKAIKTYDLNYAYCIHFYGHLNIGEKAVLVVAGAKHRGEAFKACEFIIDTVKVELPIWKKEHYFDSSSQWIGCHHCHEKKHEVAKALR